VPGVLVGDIDAAIEKIVSAGTRSCISVSEIGDRPEFMYRMDGVGTLTPYSTAPVGRTQDMEPLHRVNGAVYVTERTALMDAGMIVDQASCVGVVMPRERSVDIDTPLDFALAEAALKNSH
jgi:CMP-N,N'-diacetyllegionaminic acid synthase